LNCARIEVPGGAVAASVAGAFAHFISHLGATYTWQTGQHVLVIKLDGNDLLFAVAANSTCDLISASAANDLAKLDVDIKHNRVAHATVTGISFAHLKDGGGRQIESERECHAHDRGRPWPRSRKTSDAL
jgi:hypothetical protein